MCTYTVKGVYNDYYDIWGNYEADEYLRPHSFKGVILSEMYYANSVDEVAKALDYDSPYDFIDDFVENADDERELKTMVEDSSKYEVIEEL